MSINPIKQFISTFLQMVSATTATHPAPQTVVTRPNSEINHFCTLPNDLLCSIFSELPNEIDALKLIDRRFCVFISNCFPLLESVLIKRFPDSYKNSQSSIKCCSDAQNLYNDCTNISKNIEAGKYRTQTIVGYKDRIEEFQIDEGYLCSFKETSSTVKICELKSGKEFRTLSCSCAVGCLQAHQGSLYVGQNDGTITIWDIKSGEKSRTLSGHGDAVMCLEIYEGCLYSVSADDTIKIWDIEKGEELRMLSGHGNDHLLERASIQIQDDRLYIGSGKDTITIWDVKNGEKLRTFRTDQDTATTFKIHEGSLYVGSSNGTITIWDLKGEEKLGTLDGHSHIIIGLQIIDGHLYSNSWDHSIKVWDLASSCLLQTFRESDGNPIWSQVYKGRFYSASTSKENTIKVWDFRFAPLTPYTKQILQENLAILGEMTRAEKTGDFEAVERLAATLHPDFRQRLKQHSFNVDAPFVWSAEVILRVQTEICIEALLHAIHGEDWDRVSQLLDHLIEIDVRNTDIYAQLAIFRDSINRRVPPDEWDEWAFDDTELDDASCLQKEEAVLEFKKTIKQRWGKDLPLLLADFGIIKETQYSEKLECRPEVLQEIGIHSPADLEVLGISCSSDLQKLPVRMERVEERNARQTQALGNQDAIFTCLNTLSESVAKRSSEAIHLLLCDESNHPWVAFQETLNALQAELNEIVSQCDHLPSAILNAFNPDAYAVIAEKVNVLIDRFNTLDREHKISKLHAYVNQQDLRLAWQALHRQRIFSLVELKQTKHSPSNFFDMGRS